MIAWQDYIASLDSYPITFDLEIKKLRGFADEFPHNADIVFVLAKLYEYYPVEKTKHHEKFDEAVVNFAAEFYNRTLSIKPDPEVIHDYGNSKLKNDLYSKPANEITKPESKSDLSIENFSKMFIFFGSKATRIAQEQVKINDVGTVRNALVEVYQRYAHIFWIPVFPLNRNYILHIPDTGQTYVKTLFQKMPEEYLHVCKQVTARTPWWNFIGILIFGLLIFWLESRRK